jgi:hypothetical protein
MQWIYTLVSSSREILIYLVKASNIFLWFHPIMYRTGNLRCTMLGILGKKRYTMLCKSQLN